MGSFGKTATQGRLADSVKIVGKRESVKSEKDHAQEIADRQPTDKKAGALSFLKTLKVLGSLALHGFSSGLGSSAMGALIARQAAAWAVKGGSRLISRGRQKSKRPMIGSPKGLGNEMKVDDEKKQTKRYIGKPY